MELILYLYRTIRKFTKKISGDNVSAYSGQAALFIIISFFPFVMFLLTLLQFFPFDESTLFESLAQVMPNVMTSFVISIINEVYETASGTLISITALTTLWSGSRGFLSIVRGLNTVYATNETRNYVIVRITSTLYTLGFAVMILLTLTLMVFGNRIYLWLVKYFPFLQNLASKFIDFRVLFGMLILTVFFLLLYLIVPNRKSSIRAELPGAIFSAAGWTLYSYVFSLYIDHMGNISYMYGSLTTIVFLLLWLYFCMNILFVGAEINHFYLTELKPNQITTPKKGAYL